MRTSTWHAANGDIINLSQSKPFLHGRLYPGTPSAAAEVSRGIRRDGQETLFAAAEALRPTLAGSVHGGTPRELDELKMRLLAAFSPKHFGLLAYSNEAGRYRLRCRPLSGPSFDSQIGLSQGFSVDFESDDPYWAQYDISQVTVSEVTPKFKFPLVINPIVFGRVSNRIVAKNTAYIDVYPKITITETEAETVTVGNATTGAEIVIEHSIEAGRELAIDMAEPSARLVSSVPGAAEDEDVTHWMSIDSDFPFACVRGNNEIYCKVENANHTPVIKVEWHQPVEGVD